MDLRPDILEHFVQPRKPGGFEYRLVTPGEDLGAALLPILENLGFIQLGTVTNYVYEAEGNSD
jgi:hypothetical protein